MPLAQIPTPDASLSWEIERMLEERHGGRQNGEEIMFRCVAHDDTTPSASYNTKKYVWNCYACGAKGSWRNLAKRLNIAIPESAGNSSRSSYAVQVVASHEYRDRDGKVLFAVDRFLEKWNGAKCKPRLPDSPAGKKTSYPKDVIKGIERVLYRLPELLAVPEGGTVAILEGEKDVDNYVKLGLSEATTNPFGAKKGDWEQWAPLFHGKHVLLFADNDKAGYERIGMLCRVLQDRVRSIKVVSFPELPEKGDLSDWLATGKQASDLQIKIDTSPTAQKWIDEQSQDTTTAFAAPIYPCTLDGNALRLYHYFGEYLRLAVGANESWYVWSDPIWKASSGAELIAFCREFPKLIRKEMDLPGVPDNVKASLRAWMVQCQHSGAVSGTIQLARGERRLWIDPNDFDQKPYVLALENGVLNLETGQFSQTGTQLDYLSMQSPVVYDPAAKCPRWEQFIQDTWEGHPEKDELIEFIGRVMFYSLTGSMKHKCFFFFHGKSNSGKSTVQDVLHELLGPLATSVNKNLLIEAKYDRHLEQLARLHKRRVYTAAEPPAAQAWASEFIKELTGGDMMSANYMRQNSFDFRGVGKLFVSGNAEPALRQYDPAFINRLKIVPFPNVWQGEVDRDFVQYQLRPELSGILNWVLSFRQRWWDSGSLAEPPCVAAKTREYQQEQDEMGGILAEYFVQCLDDPTLTCTVDDAYRQYLRFCQDEGIDEKFRWSKRGFGARLKERGIGQVNRAGRRWVGIGLRTD